MRTICLCGSTRFADHFKRLTTELSLRGHVVYTIALAKEDASAGMTDEQKLILDAVHMGKIANSDSVHFINVDGYMGESTRREFYFACVMGKTFTFEEPSKLTDEVKEHIKNLRPTSFEAYVEDIRSDIDNAARC
mgnify:CR=1 FL=1